MFPRLFRSPNNLGGYYTVSVANSLIEQISMLIIMTESAEFSLTDKNHMPFVPLRNEPHRLSNQKNFVYLAEIGD